MVKKLKLFKRIKSRQYIKDKALVHFILQHSKKETINFPKIKIHSFSNYLHTKENDCKDKKIKGLTRNVKVGKNQNKREMPDFRLSLLSFFCVDKKAEDAPKFKSFIFK